MHKSSRRDHRTAIVIELARAIRHAHGTGQAARYLRARGVGLGTALRVLHGDRCR